MSDDGAVTTTVTYGTYENLLNGSGGGLVGGSLAYPTPEPIPYDPLQEGNTSQQRYYGGESVGSGTPGVWCAPNEHRFGCKHELICACGRTQRIDVPEGL